MQGCGAPKCPFRQYATFASSQPLLNLVWQPVSRFENLLTVVSQRSSDSREGAFQFLYIPSDSRWNSPPTPSFFPSNHPLFEQTDGVLRRRVTSPNWGLLGQSGHGGSERCNRGSRTVQIRESSAFQPSCLPTSSNPRPPRHPWLGATVAARWRYGGGPMGPDPHGTGKPPPSHRLATGKPPASHRQASHPLTSPSSKRAENTSLRPTGAVRLGPTGKAAKDVGRGDLGARRSGHVPRHPSQSRPRPGLLDAPCLLPPDSGTLPETELGPPPHSPRVARSTPSN
jgi:hypothetical protein